VEGLVNGKVCSQPGGLIPAGASLSVYQIVVAGDAVMPGCAKAGDRITFRANGVPANETAVWQLGTVTMLNLTANSGPTYVPPSLPPVTADPPVTFLPPSTGDAGLKP
jgi:hypothetical protein